MFFISNIGKSGLGLEGDIVVEFPFFFFFNIKGNIFICTRIYSYESGQLEKLLPSLTVLLMATGLKLAFPDCFISFTVLDACHSPCIVQ